MSDPLAHWWRHEVTVEPLEGSGAYGDVHGAPFTLMAAVDDARKLVRDSTGAEVVSETRVYGPITTPAIPEGSRVTLPSPFGGPGQTRTSTVVAVSRLTSGGLPTPDHVEVSLA